jgi:hypothetical protein
MYLRQLLSLIIVPHCLLDTEFRAGRLQSKNAEEEMRISLKSNALILTMSETKHFNIP